MNNSVEEKEEERKLFKSRASLRNKEREIFN